MDAAPGTAIQTRLAVLSSALQRPEVNPFLCGGPVLAFVAAHEERAAQAVLQGLPPAVRGRIRMESGTGFARLMAAAFQCSADLRTAAELLLRRPARGVRAWERLLAVERQCNLWTRDAFYVMTGVRLLDDSRLLRSDVVAKAWDRWRRGRAAARRRALPAPAQRDWRPPPAAPAPAPAPAPRDWGPLPAGPAPGGWGPPPAAPAPREWGPPPAAPAPREWGPPPAAPAPREWGMPPAAPAPGGWAPPPPSAPLPSASASASAPAPALRALRPPGAVPAPSSDCGFPVPPPKGGGSPDSAPAPTGAPCAGCCDPALRRH